MPLGICKLCRPTKPVELKDSHLIPKGLYKVLQQAMAADEQRNTNPLVITPKVMIQTSKQVSDYVLCDACEDRLNKGGERWMIANCWRSDSEFPLRRALENLSPVAVVRGGRGIHEVPPAVDVAQIVHFGAGVFWRAAAHMWSDQAGGWRKRLHFGPYEEDLRLFVLGEKPFPANAAILVTVSSADEPGANEFTIFPFERGKKSWGRQYGFAIPGVMFQLFLGKGIPEELHFGCVTSVRTPRLCFGSNEHFLWDMEKIRRKTTPKGAAKRFS